MEDWQRKLMKGAVGVIYLNVVGKLDLPPFNTPPRTWNELSNYVDAVEFSSGLEQTLQINSELLRETAKDLISNHAVAATVKVGEPTDADVDAMAKGLAKISEDLKGDQKFKTAVALAGSVVSIVGQLRGG